MSYRVEYPGDSRKTGEKKGSSLSFQVMTGLFLLLFVLAVRGLWPQGRQVLEQWLLPDHMAPAQAAIGELVTDLAQGNSFSDSFGDFCQEVFAIRETNPR